VSIDGINVMADSGVTEAEIQAIVNEEKQLWEKKGKSLGKIEVSIENDELVVKASERSPITRVRRITGYLSTIDHFNDAKQAELLDRVKHVRSQL
jgi:anaerobic ribonucleoside-triphosphate reductase activating protein